MSPRRRIRTSTSETFSNLASQKRPEMLTRKAMIIQMKEDREKEEIAAQQAIEEERRLEEERRAAEEKERLEQERLKREKENEEKEELKKRRKRAINLARDVLGADYKFSDDLTIEQIEELKEKHIKQAKYERAEKKKKRVLQAREIDFQVRALREAEQPLLIESFERSVEQSNTEFVTEFEKFKSVSHKKFQKNIKVKAGLSKMKSLLDTFTDVLVGNRTDLEIRLARKRSKIRRAEGRQREELERVRKEEEEEERRRQEALKRAEERKQKELEEKQRRKEEAQRRAEARQSRSGKYVPPSQRNRENRENIRQSRPGGSSRWSKNSECDDRGDFKRREENGGNRSLILSPVVKMRRHHRRHRRRLQESGVRVDDGRKSSVIRMLAIGVFSLKIKIHIYV